MEENENNNWLDFLITLYLLGEKSILQLVKELKQDYNNTFENIQDKINAFYGKYNIQNNTTYSDITNKLSNTELIQFKKRLYKIIMYAEKHNFDKSIIKRV